LAEVDFTPAEEKILRKAGLWFEIERVIADKDLSSAEAGS
jgi:hypothetical protein